MPDEKEKQGFNLDDVAREIADESDAAESAEEVVAEEGAEPAAAVETQEEAAPAAADEEDDEKWAASHGGKPIPQTAFQARLQRWKKKENELSERYKLSQAEIETLKKAQPATAADLERFKRLDGVFQNLDKSAREMPWVTDMLLALGQGKRPDWNKVKEGMEAYIASVPKGDPILYQKQQEIENQLVELQTERLANQAITHIQSEDVEIAKIFGDKSDPVAAQYWAILNEQAKHAFDAMNPKSFKEGPNRVQMATRLMASAKAFHQAQLKKAAPAAARQAPIKTGSGSGGSAPEKSKPPTDIHSKAFADHLLAGLT